MFRLEQISYLNEILLSEMLQYREQSKQFSQDTTFQRRLFCSLMNLRPPMPLDTEFLRAQDALLCAE